MDAPEETDHAGQDHIRQQIEQLRAKKAVVSSPIDDEIEKLTQQLESGLSHAALTSTVDSLPSNQAEPLAGDALGTLIAACASDSLNAFARARRLLFKANIRISSVRSDRNISLLHTCARFGSVKILNQLLDSEPGIFGIIDDLGRDALTVSVLYRQLHVFHILSQSKDCSYAHQSLPFLNNCLHSIARFGLFSFAREILNTNRGNEPKVQLAMSQYNKDGLLPIHIMCARLDIEMITQAFCVNPQWLDACTATGANIIDMAVTGERGLLSPSDCFDFICAITQLHPPAKEQFLLAASNRYKHTGVIARCSGALLALVRVPSNETRIRASQSITTPFLSFNLFVANALFQVVLESSCSADCLKHISKATSTTAKVFADAVLTQCIFLAQIRATQLPLIQSAGTLRFQLFLRC
jgi:hypothetical protein